MFVYFADWTSEARLRNLAEKGASVVGKIIKAYASPIDPRILTGKSLKTLAISGKAFGNRETFNYGSRFNLTGTELEDYMDKTGLSEEGKKYLRAVFRFGNTEPIDVIKFAMEIAVSGNWYFMHPLDPVHGPIHGIDEAVSRPNQRIPAIHLDIFTERTLPLLSQVVDFHDANQILDERETIEVIRGIRSYREGNFSGNERV